MLLAHCLAATVCTATLPVIQDRFIPCCVKGKGHPVTCHENTEGSRGIALLFL